MHKIKEYNIHLSKLIKWYLNKADSNQKALVMVLKAIPVPQPLYPSLGATARLFICGAGGWNWGVSGCSRLEITSCMNI